MINKKIKKELEAAISGVTPGLQVQAFFKGQKLLDIEVGETYPYYDFASITKSLLTTTLFMHLYEDHPRILEDKVLKYLPWYAQHDLGIRQLLTHTSGLVWWKPLYLSLDMNQIRQERWEFLKTIIAKEKLEPTPYAVYSDLNFMMLGYLLEENFKKPLDKLWDVVSNEFGLSKTHFHIDNKPVFDAKKYAPTEKCPWRNKRLQGEAHDENAWALGGVAPHAGLFGTIEDLSKWILGMRSIFLGESSTKFISQDTAQAFFQRAIAKNVGDFALGFMMRSAQNSSTGSYFSLDTIGHTGFTGTSFWYDIKNDLIVNVLSNRVYYGRENGEEFKKLRIKIHDLCFKEIVGV